MKLKIVLLLISLQLVAQQNKSIVKIEYSETIRYIPAITNNYSSTLYVQNEYSYYKSVYLNTERTTQNENDDMIVVNSTLNKFNGEVYVNSKTKQLTENLYENIFLKKSFSVTEDVPRMKWTLLKGEKKFNNLICKKAKTTFRGRTYNVLYTENIPIATGPWKLNGLPGLILFAEDAEGIYKWEAKNIRYPYVEKKIDLKDVYTNRDKYKKTSFKAFDQILNTAINNKIKISRARNTSRESISGFSYNTLQKREPINEWRTLTEFN